VAEIKLVGLSSAVPARPSLRIVESRGADRWTHVSILDEGSEIEGADRLMRATLEIEVPAPAGASAACEFVQLGCPAGAIEEAFNRTIRDADMARTMKLPGALSARRYRLEAVAGKCDWELMTLYGFAGDDPRALTEALADSCDVWEGDPSCIVMRVVPAHQGAERA
jgi:hypothetical protein